MSKRGKSALVLANGPSVGRLDPQKIRGMQQRGEIEVFVVNSYIASGMAQIVLPEHYVLSDPAFFGVYNELQTSERIVELQREVPRIIDLDTQVYLPLEFHANWNGKRPAIAFCDVQDFFSSNAVDILKPRGYHTLTAYKALAIALYQGFDTVYICGFDNDYFKTVTVDANNQLYHCNNHFYRNNADPMGSTRMKILPSDARNVGELLYNLHFNFKHLEKFAGHSVINLDPDGLVDCFPKGHRLDVYREVRAP